MFIAGTSFALHFRAFRDPGRYWKNTEFRLFARGCGGSRHHHIGWPMGRSPPYRQHPGLVVHPRWRSLRPPGFATADFGMWVPALQILVVGLMFVGGMAGSTAGGIKVYRIGVLTKAASADLRRLIHPRGVFVTRFGANRVSDPIVESVQSFFLFFMFMFMTGTFLMGFLGATFGPEMDIVTAASATASALGNIGPALGELSPSGNYLEVTWPGKWLLALLMIAGRLELFPVLLLFTRALWRR